MGNSVLMAFRSFRKHKFFTLIHISGLAIGISAALVIYLIVQHEFSYEKGLKDRDRIYRVVSSIQFPDLLIYNSGVPAPTPAVVRSEGTGIETLTHFLSVSGVKVEVAKGGELRPATFRKQQDVTYADEHYFDVFQYEWLAGAGAASLKEPFRVVLTESRAKTYFASMAYPDMLGRTITYNDSIRAVVAGVVKDPGWVTDLHFKEFISQATITATGLKNHWSWEDWGSINSSSQLLLKLAPGTNPATVEKQLAALRDRHRPKNGEKEVMRISHILQPMTDVHFNPDFDAFEQRQGNRKVLMGLLAVGAFLLLLGCINFINLSTALAGQRAKEIGIRKTLGSSKKQLVSQFLGETAVLAFMATLFSVLITPWLLQVFKDFIPPGVDFSSLNQAHVWFFLLVMILLVTLLSGMYPALVLTQFKPVTVMKNQAGVGTSQTRKAWLRKTLTVTQFVIAQFLIIATLVLAKQIHFSLTKDLGFRKEAIVYFELPWNVFSNKPDSRRHVLVDKLKAIPELTNVVLAGSPPAEFGYSQTSMVYDNGKKKIETMVEQKTGDSAYFQLYALKLVAGRYMQPGDTARDYVINETFARFLGFSNPRDAVGIILDHNGGKPVSGVVRDFHARSTREPIKPLVYGANMDNSYVLHLGLAPRGEDPDAWRRALKKAEVAFKQVYPDEEFNHKFFDENIALFYKSEQNIVRLLKWATGLCIFISCLGLLGLVIFTTHIRTKEIGVRKVLGASVAQIVALLSKDFVLLVMVAFAIAAPAAWWFMHDWLQDFAYRTPISWWIFAACGLGMLLIALVILSIRTIRAAMDNPVHSLRTE